MEGASERKTKERRREGGTNRTKKNKKLPTLCKRGNFFVDQNSIS